MMPISRRSVLETITGVAGLRSLGLLASPTLIPLSQAQVTPEIATFAPEVESLVTLIERTPREKCAEMLVEQLRKEIPHRQLMAALFLAGIRNVNPRPPGFALHCVFVIHSAHVIGLQAPDDSRLLPLFYSLDVFKASQERDARQSAGDYVMRPIRDPLPSSEKAATEFSSAMEAWDSERAERAVVALARHRGAADVFEQLWRYGARDYRNIGHKAIYVANAERTLKTIGWAHAEPVLRSLVLSLLDFGQDQQVNGYAFSDQSYLGNVNRLKTSLARLDGKWINKPADPVVTRAILKEMRKSPPEAACAAVSERILKGNAGAQTIWDAVHLSGAELRMRVSGGASILGVHAVTACNGLHHSYLAASDPAVRLLILLQAVGWMGQFRTWSDTRKENIRDYSITDLAPNRAAAEIFENPDADPDGSAARAMHLAGTPDSRQVFLKTALRYTLAKADEVHYYKYLAALIEDIPLVSPSWQPHLVATLVFYVKGSRDPEPVWASNAREALRALV